MVIAGAAPAPGSDRELGICCERLTTWANKPPNWNAVDAWRVVSCAERTENWFKPEFSASRRTSRPDRPFPIAEPAMSGRAGASAGVVAVP